MEDGRIHSCPICGRFYTIRPAGSGDQSCCPSCREEELKAVKRPDTPEQIRRRKEHFQ